jgi:hypothetical protein
MAPMIASTSDRGKPKRSARGNQEPVMRYNVAVLTDETGLRNRAWPEAAIGSFGVAAPLVANGTA